MISEQVAPMLAPVKKKLTPEQQAEVDKRILFEDQLQAYYALRKTKINPDKVLAGSPEQDRFIKHLAHPILRDAFRTWFTELNRSGDRLIPDYLATHTEEEITKKKDMDVILAVLESSRHHRTLH